MDKWAENNLHFKPPQREGHIYNLINSAFIMAP